MPRCFVDLVNITSAPSDLRTREATSAGLRTIMVRRHCHIYSFRCTMRRKYDWSMKSWSDPSKGKKINIFTRYLILFQMLRDIPQCQWVPLVKERTLQSLWSLALMLTQQLDSKCYFCRVWNTRRHVTSRLIQLCVKGEPFLQPLPLIETNSFYHAHFCSYLSSYLLEVRGNFISKPMLDRFSLNMLKADDKGRNKVRLKLFHSNNSSRLWVPYNEFIWPAIFMNNKSIFMASPRTWVAECVRSFTSRELDNYICQNWKV